MKMAWKKSAIAFLVLTALGLALPNGLSYGTNVNVKAEAEEDTTVPEYVHFTVVENYNTPERYYAMLKSCDKDYKGIVTIPNKVDGKTVKAIAQSAFLNCTGIENVIITFGQVFCRRKSRLQKFFFHHGGFRLVCFAAEGFYDECCHYCFFLTSEANLCAKSPSCSAKIEAYFA